MPSPKPGLGERADDLAHPVGAEVEAQHAVRGADPAPFADRGRPDELVGLAALVGGACGRWPVRRVVLGAAVDEQVIGVLGSVPAPVAVHRPVAPDDGRDAAGAGPAAPVLECGQVALARGRRGVTTVGEAVEHQISDPQLCGASSISAWRWRKPEWTPPSDTIPTRWTRSVALSASRTTGLFAERSVGDGVVDQRERLRHDGSGAEGQVPDLGVSHLAVG